MKLYIAVSGKDEEDVLNQLRKAVDNPAEFTENDAYVEHSDGYTVNFQWVNEDGPAMLVDYKYKN